MPSSPHPLPLVSARLPAGAGEERVGIFRSARDLTERSEASAVLLSYARTRLSETKHLIGGNLKAAPLEEGRRPLGRRTKRPDDAAPWALGSPMRLAALTLLHEEPLSPSQIADVLRVDVKIATEHLRKLYEAGCIEFVGYRRQGGRNASRAIYRAVDRPYVSLEVYRAMSSEERKDLNGIALQWIMAECIASHRSGKMSKDKTLCLLSDEPVLDAQGREELHDFLVSMWEGAPDEEGTQKSIQEIASRATTRLADSSGSGTTVVVALLAFERSRTREPKSELGTSLGE